MTGTGLVDAGFTQSEPTRAVSKFADWMYQLKVRDEYGTKYFITVFEYDSTSHRFEADIYYNEGCEFFPSSAAVGVKVYSGIDSWTPAQLVDAAEQFWKRLCPIYYEADERRRLAAQPEAREG